MTKQRCPCCSGLAYERCCAPYHLGELPLSPEALMRSLYSAIAKGLAEYIANTQVQPCNLEEIQQFASHTTFEKLEVLEAKGDTVLFVAHLRQQGKDCSFREKSYFVKQKGKWVYSHGDLEK